MVVGAYKVIQDFNLSVFLIPFLPLFASIVTLLFGRNYFRNKAHYIPVLALFLSFLLSLKTLIEVISGKIYHFDLYTWIFAG
ncbi:MAG: NADH-quinone oxidoreductase subunit L, partial [Caldimicrobium sp.]